MSEQPVTVEQLKALCREFGYPEPGPNTIKAAQENGLSEEELRQRFIAMRVITEDANEWPSPAELDDAYERAMNRTRVGGKSHVVQIFYDLCSKVIEESNWIDAGGSLRGYLVTEEARNDLAGFVADFHDDNPALWNLLSDEQKRRFES